MAITLNEVVDQKSKDLYLQQQEELARAKQEELVKQPTSGSQSLTSNETVNKILDNKFTRGLTNLLPFRLPDEFKELYHKKSNFAERTPESYFFAAFANASYGALDGFKMANKKLKEGLLPQEYRMFNLDTALSDKNIVVYVSPGKVVTAIRGTVVSQARDLWADVQIAISPKQANSRFKSAKIRMQQVLDKYPQSKHFVCGHSLGGSICQYLFGQFKGKLQVFCFNPGAGLSVIAKQFKCLFKKRQNNLINFLIPGDPVSAIAVDDPCYASIMFEKRPNMNAHTLAQFLRLSETQEKQTKNQKRIFEQLDYGAAFQADIQNFKRQDTKPNETIKDGISDIYIPPTKEIPSLIPPKTTDPQKTTDPPATREPNYTKTKYPSLPGSGGGMAGSGSGIKTAIM